MKRKNITLGTSLYCFTCAGAVMLTASGVMAQNVFVGDDSNGSILEYSGGTASTFATGMNYPTGLAFDNSGDLFESDQGSGHIYEWAGAGSTRTTFASGVNAPALMIFNAAGDLFVSGGSIVTEFSPTGVILNTITGLTQPSGLAFDAAGNLYVGSINGGGAGQGNITKITPGGTRSTFASGITYPYGMAFNAAGDLFVSDAYGSAGGTGYDAITEITPGGSESTFASGLSNPGDISFDAAGNMFVDEWGIHGGNGDIREYAPNGTQSVFASGFVPTSIAIQPVPEPSLLGLCGTGVVASLLFARGRKSTGKSELVPQLKQ